MDFKNFPLPFTEAWLDATIRDLTPERIETALRNIASLPEDDDRENLMLTLVIGIVLATPEKHGIATIQHITKGRYKGQFKVVLKGDNGEPIDPANETYENEKDLRKTLARYYSTFEVVG